MGTSVQHLSHNVSLIASNSTWIEGLATQQLIKTSQLDQMQYVAGMPDLHPGRGYPIGAAFFSVDKIYPALVGNDIGCGMAFWQTDLKAAKINVDKLSKKLVGLEQPLDESWHAWITQRKQEKNIEISDFDASLGTIGGGNHFCEFQSIDTVYDESECKALGVDKKCLQLLVHSGSRGLGQSILTQHIRQSNHDGLRCKTTEFDLYIEQHDQAVKWAELNRELIALRFLEKLRGDGHCLTDLTHNSMTRQPLAGQQGWLHRKGATPSDQGYVVIPGSRGDYSYLVKPTLNESPLELQDHLFSLAHGAGRKWKRGECRGRLAKNFSKEDLLRTPLGGRVICGDKELLFDEAPQAYKKCATVIDDLVKVRLVQPIARLKPVLTYKTLG